MIFHYQIGLPKKDTTIYCTQLSTTLLFNFNDLMDIIIKWIIVYLTLILPPNEKNKQNFFEKNKKWSFSKKWFSSSTLNYLLLYNFVSRLWEQSVRHHQLKVKQTNKTKQLLVTTTYILLHTTIVLNTFQRLWKCK